jgi:hypothetical protein
MIIMKNIILLFCCCINFTVTAQTKIDSYCQNCNVVKAFFDEDLLYKIVHIEPFPNGEGINPFGYNHTDTVHVLDMSRKCFFECNINQIRGSYYRLLERDIIPEPLHAVDLLYSRKCKDFERYIKPYFIIRSIEKKRNKIILKVYKLNDNYSFDFIYRVKKGSIKLIRYRIFYGTDSKNYKYIKYEKNN